MQSFFLCVHVCWFLELKKTWLIDHSRNFMQGIWDSVLRASHVPWDALRHLHSESPRGMWPFSHPTQLQACPQISCRFLFLDCGRPAGWWEGSQSDHAGMIPNRLSLHLQEPSLILDLISGLVTEPLHWKTPTGRPRTCWTRLIRCYWGQRSEASDDLLTSRPPQHWSDSRNQSSEMADFFPNLNSSPTKPEWKY